VLVVLAVLVSAKCEAKGSPGTSEGQSALVEEMPPALLDVDPSNGIDAPAFVPMTGAR
jgi:hypothetical protein